MMRAGVQHYGSLLAELGAEPVVRGPWSIVGQSSIEYGWKLHLSSVQSQASDLIRTIFPLLGRYSAPFKVARDSDILGMLNEGSLGSTQVGKFATIYPSTPEEGLRLAYDLINATTAFEGPRIVTDLHLGGAVYTRYGAFSPKMLRDRLGMFVAADADNQGDYKIPFVPPFGIDNPFVSFAPRPMLPQTRPALLDHGYLIVRPIQVHAKGSVFLAIDVRDQQKVRKVVLKEGLRHCQSDVYGRHMWDRLRNQAAVHAAVANRVPTPATGALFCHGESLYLPLEFVEGTDFGDRRAVPFSRLTVSEQVKLLELLRKITAALGALHAQGYVHRDLSMRNIRVTPDGEVYLIDLEISYRVGDLGNHPFSQGTAGFVSPSQLADNDPTVADDIFSLGSVVICALTGLDPQRVIYARTADRCSQLSNLSGAPRNVCRVIAFCVAEDPSVRPTLRHIELALGQALRGLAAPFSPWNSAETSARSGYAALVQAGLAWLTQGASRAEPDGIWLSPDLQASEHASLKLVHGYRVYRNANRGVAGVVYVLAKLHRFGFSTQLAARDVNAAVDWLLDHRPTPDDQMVGLHFGEAGVAVAIAEAIASGLIDRGPWLKPYIREALLGPIDWPDLTHGAAGQGLAAFACADLLEDPSLASLADRCAEYLMDTQQADGSWVLPAGVKAMSEATYTGFAHGVAGIVTFLATFARRTADSKACDAADLGGQWLISQARIGRGGVSVSWPMRLGSPESWAWWCHGGPGIALSFMALFRLSGDEMYAGAARAALRYHPIDVRYPNMSQCHGLSGLGEILLDAYHVFNEPEWLQRAEAIGSLLANLARQSPEGASWLVENLYQPTPDLMIGVGGVVHFLARLERRDRAFRAPLTPCDP